ncbi:unnamed protein product [Chondrus crispus]|uniref:Uncharacterized protein n=1 Tax=Chondrus crispus TaxID=2769 RepID=R7QN91_CHOCR|nr:unnamed protein product [Chondrus crispus]CDF39967.1 unnamed protein product [Chondrus crispus]|eukprot:XP_005710261.1 unnamed protein product [Chondrus crispus]
MSCPSLSCIGLARFSSSAALTAFSGKPSGTVSGRSAMALTELDCRRPGFKNGAARVDKRQAKYRSPPDTQVRQISSLKTTTPCCLEVCCSV